MDHVRRTIVKRLKERGLDMKAVSLEIGMNHAYLQQFIERGVPAKLKEDVRSRLAEALGLSEQDLGARTSDDTANVIRKRQTNDDVRELDARAGAGGGGVFDLVNVTDDHGNQLSSEVVKDYWSVPSSFLRGELRLEAAKAVIIEVTGDSGYDPSNPHAPGSLFPGDRVIVNALDTRPTPPGPFLVHDGNGFVVKLCEPVHGSDPPAIRLASRNPAYTPYSITLDDGHVVVGRVVGRFTRM